MIRPLTAIGPWGYSPRSWSSCRSAVQDSALIARRKFDFLQLFNGLFSRCNWQASAGNPALHDQGKVGAARKIHASTPFVDQVDDGLIHYSGECASSRFVVAHDGATQADERNARHDLTCISDSADSFDSSDRMQMPSQLPRSLPPNFNGLCL